MSKGDTHPALVEMRQIALETLQGQHEPTELASSLRRAANHLYFLAVDAGAFSRGSENMVEVAAYGSGLEQMADALERNWGKVERRKQYEPLILEGMVALVRGAPLPEW